MSGHTPEPSSCMLALVDDEPRIHEMLDPVLAAADFVQGVQHYDDPRSFLTALTQKVTVPDLILLDVHFENSGLTGVDILPFIREELPFTPVILLTGMEGEVIEDAQDYDVTYYIPKPVDPDHLLRMIRFYLGTGHKSGQRMARLQQDLADQQDLLDMLDKELQAKDGQGHKSEPQRESKSIKIFERMIDILGSVLKNSELMDSFVQDLEKIMDSDFKLLKKTVETVIRFDLEGSSATGLNIHKVKGTQHVYTIRVSRKVRIFYYQGPQSNRRRMLRLDHEHDTKGMDKWLKANADSYTQ